VLLSLEGGYNPAGVADGVESCIRTLLTYQPTTTTTTTSGGGGGSSGNSSTTNSTSGGGGGGGGSSVNPQTLRDIEEVIGYQREYWQCLREERGGGV